MLGWNQGFAFGSVKFETFEKTEWRYRVSRQLDKPGIEEQGAGQSQKLGGKQHFGAERTGLLRMEREDIWG